MRCAFRAHVLIFKALHLTFCSLVRRGQLKTIDRGSGVSETSSREEELKGLDNSQLVEMVLVLKQHEIQLIEERDVLRGKLRLLESTDPDSIPVSDMFASMSGIVDQAQQTAERCLESVRDMNQKAQEANMRIIEAAEKKAAAIVEDARMQAQRMLNEARTKALEISENAQMLQDDLDAIFDDIDDRADVAEAYSVPDAKDYLENVGAYYSYDYQPKLPYEAQFMEQSEGLPGVDSEDIFTEDILEDEDDLFGDIRIGPGSIQAPTVMIVIGEEENWDKADSASFADEAIEEGIPDEFDAGSIDEEASFAEEDLKNFEANIEQFDPEVLIDDASYGSDPYQESAPNASESTDAVEGKVCPQETKTKAELDQHAEPSSESAVSQNANAESFEPLDPSISGLLSMTKAERKAAKKAAKKARKAAKRSGNPRLAKLKGESAPKLSEDESYPISPDTQSTGEMEPIKVDDQGNVFAGASPYADSSDTPYREGGRSGSERRILRTSEVPEIMQASYERFTNVNRVQDQIESDFDVEMYLDDDDIYKTMDDARISGH